MKYNELISKENKKTSETLGYVEHLLIQTSTFIGCVSISAFASVVCISVRNASSAVGWKICVITVEIKKNKSIANKKIRKHVKIVILAKSGLNSIEIIISNASIHSYISHEQFISLNNVLKEHDEIKAKIRNLKTKTCLV